VAARQGLQAPSFAEAAVAYQEAVGGSISGSTVRRITEEMGRHVHDLRKAEAERAMALPAPGESPRDRRVEEYNPVFGQANISTDGAMVLTREWRWKAVKGAAMSHVEGLGAGVSTGKAAKRGKGRREGEPEVILSQHSYVIGLWEADQFLPYQYAEGLRRGLERVKRLTAVSDGSPWIERVTMTNFPQAVQVVDWSHAKERLWTVAKAVYGEGSAEAALWAEAREGELWQGQVEEVVKALEKLSTERPELPEIVRQSVGYFAGNKERMRYQRFRMAGYPIGSGTIESAVKNVVHRRMKRPGQGWKWENVNPMLAALCELHSGRFEHAWQQTCHFSTKTHLQF